MDPLSGLASLIAVIQLTGAIASICYDYRSGVKNAPKDVLDIINEVDSLRDVLKSLESVIEKELREADSGDISQLSTTELLMKTNGPLTDCKAELINLRAKLQPQDGWRALGQLLVWPLKKNEVNKTLLRMERFKAALSLALSVDQTYVEVNFSHSLFNLRRRML